MEANKIGFGPPPLPPLLKHDRKLRIDIVVAVSEGVQKRDNKAKFYVRLASQIRRR
jgi:hypothetical protein